MKSNKNMRVFYFGLCLASVWLIGSITIGPGASLELQNLIVHDNTIYADFNSTIFHSTDGKTWIKIDFNHPAETDMELPTQVIDQIGAKSAELPVTVCLPDNSSICYQTAEEAILQSQDSGKTWSASWSISAGRKNFMERATHPRFTIGPYDLVISTTNNTQIIVAAMGEGGVLVKTNDGPWESVEVNGLGPLPSDAPELGHILSAIRREAGWLNLMAMICLFILFLKNKRKFDTLPMSVRFSPDSFTIFFILFCIFVAFINLLVYLMGVVFSGNYGFSTSFFLLAALSFHQVLTDRNTHGRTDFILLFLTWLISYIIFILWGYGTIPVYETALNINIILGAFFLLWFLYTLLKSVFKIDPINPSDSQL